MNNENTRQRNITTVRKFLSLLQEEKIEAMLDLFAAEGKQINPYASGLFPAEVQGRAALREYWEPVPARFDGMQFPVEQIWPMEDPSCILVKFKGIIRLKNNAGNYNNDYLGLFQFNESGKITEYHEYFNPVSVIRAFNLQDKL